MNYHILPGNILHLTPNITRGQISSINRLCPGTVDQNFFCVIMYYDKMLYSNVESNPYDALFTELEVKTYKLFYSFSELYKFIISRSKDSQIIYHKKMIEKEQILINMSLSVLKPKLLRRSSMICWGAGDFLLERGNSLKRKLMNACIAFSYKRYKHLYAISKEDYLLLVKEHPKSNGMYLPYLRSTPLERLRSSRINKRPLVMVSHSGWPHNHHIDTFRKLSKFAGEIDVLCPLCYGDKDYIQNVISEGNRIFGEGFQYFQDLKKYKDYQDLVLSVDVFVSSAEVQTGLGAISICISGGCKLYLSGNNYSSMRESGLYVEEVDKIPSMALAEFLSPLSDSESQHNIDVRNRETYDGDYVVYNWKKLYQG